MQTAALPSTSSVPSRARNLTAAGLLLGALLYVLGALWDIQWHVDVGPDTFFTAPHTLLYSGMTIAGVVALVSVLRRQATHGVWMAGLGALCFLLGGLFDRWWHTLYGFDVTLASPPHIMLLLSGMIELSGLLFHLGAEVTRIRRVEERQGGVLFAELCFVGALASLFTVVGSFILLLFLWEVEMIGPVATVPVVQALFVGAFGAVAISFLRRPGAATALAVGVLLWKLVLALLVPVLVGGLSDYLALGYQGNALHYSVAAFVLSPYILLVGVLADGVLWLAQRRALPPPLVVAMVLGVGALLLYLVDPFWVRYIYTWPWLQPGEAERISLIYEPTRVVTALVLPLVGAGAALGGWRFGQILRYQRQ